MNEYRPRSYLPRDRMPRQGTPVIGAIRRLHGVSPLAFEVEVTYPGRATEIIMFVRKREPDSDVMVMPDGDSSFFVDRAERFGVFGPAWIHQFLGAPEQLVEVADDITRLAAVATSPDARNYESKAKTRN